MLGATWNTPALQGFGGQGTELDTLPTTIKQHLLATGDLSWRVELWQTDAKQNPEAVLRAPERTYQAGATYHTTFGTGVFGPRVFGESRAWRHGDVLSMSVAPFSDRAGHLGTSRTSKARVTLTANDTTLMETDQSPFDLSMAPYATATGLAAAPIRYTLTTDFSHGTRRGRGQHSSDHTLEFHLRRPW
ncbi:hypothetical protein [Streptomyces sp. NPDC057675]|uniref:hypothetical protein n=1 Tax=Streptomyces sp. NPDC057675 TaxID=3346204 RepID=UPI0036B55C36